MTTDTCNNMDQLQTHYAKLTKPNSKLDTVKFHSNDILEKAKLIRTENQERKSGRPSLSQKLSGPFSLCLTSSLLPVTARRSDFLNQASSHESHTALYFPLKSSISFFSPTSQTSQLYLLKSCSLTRQLFTFKKPSSAFFRSLTT